MPCQNSDSKTHTDDLELSISSSEFATNPTNLVKNNQKRTNSEFWTPAFNSENRKKLFRWASQNFLATSSSDRKTTDEEKYLWNQNLRTQNEQLNQRLKKYRQYLDNQSDVHSKLASWKYENISGDRSVIPEELDENKSSSICTSIPSKIHAFTNKLEGRLRDEPSLQYGKGYRFEIANSSVSKSALDIFKAHYNNMLN